MDERFAVLFAFVTIEIAICGFLLCFEGNTLLSLWHFAYVRLAIFATFILQGFCAVAYLSMPQSKVNKTSSKTKVKLKI